MKNYYVSIIRRCELAYIRSELEEFGLSPLEGRLIRLLKDKFCSQEQLAEDLDIDKSRIARTMFLLEEKGLVHRVVNEKNRRQKIVSLTENGLKVYDAICYRGFTEEERKINQEFVKRISQNVVGYKKENGGKNHG